MRLSDDDRLRDFNAEQSHAYPSFIGTIMQAFCTLHRISWSAPWLDERR